MKQLTDYVTTIPDFPKEGIMFRDITTIINNPEGFSMAIDQLVEQLKGIEFDLIVGSESRGFIFGAPVAYAMKKGFILARKKGKLPREVISEEYDLEYGSATLEMHADAIKPGQRIVIIDDLIATGGTTVAITKLVERLGGEIVKIGFVMELEGLKGRELLSKYDVFSLIQYPGN
jgi:adenine phosphoribosyltransferase